MDANTGQSSVQSAPTPCAEAGRCLWRVGAATTVFPTGPGLPMAGYVARQGHSASLLDELTVAAVVLERDSRRSILLTADIIGVDETLVAEISQAAGITDDLLLCASHTHSGPAGVVKRLHPSESEWHDPAVRQAFVETSTSVIRDALAALQPASLWFGQANAQGVAANRNTPTRPSSNRVSVLEARRLDGSQIALIIHFACHPTILGADNLAISADLVGGMREALVTSGSLASVPILFMNGAAGDISTRFTRRAQEPSEVTRLGTLLAEGVLAARSHTYPLVDGLKTIYANVETTLKAYGSLALLGEAATRLRDEATRTLAGHAPPELQRLAQTRAEGAELQVQLARTGAAPRQFTLIGQNLGGVLLVAIPGELFASLGQTIEKQSPGQPVIVVGYANGYVGYIADEQAYTDETYEALASPYSPDLGLRVVDTTRHLIQRLTTQ